MSPGCVSISTITCDPSSNASAAWKTSLFTYKKYGHGAFAFREGGEFNGLNRVWPLAFLNFVSVMSIVFIHFFFQVVQAQSVSFIVVREQINSN